MILHNSHEQLRRQVYEYLRDRMRTGAFKPGSSIKSGQIVQELGVSKTPLRDALIQLESEGFVTVLPQRGVVINFLQCRTPALCIRFLAGWSHESSFQFQKIMEPEVAEFKRLNDKMLELAATPNANFKDYNDLNILFHDVFLNLSENELLLRYVRFLKRRLYDFPDRSYGIDWENRNVNEHQEFVQLVEDGNAKRVADYMRDVNWTFRYPEVLSEED